MLHKSYKKRTCGKNLLHNLHGQFSGIQNFIFNFNSSKLLLFFMKSGTISQILGPKNVRVVQGFNIISPKFSFFFLSHKNAVHFPRRFRS